MNVLGGQSNRAGPLQDILSTDEAGREIPLLKDDAQSALFVQSVVDKIASSSLKSEAIARLTVG